MGGERDRNTADSRCSRRAAVSSRSDELRREPDRHGAVMIRGKLRAPQASLGRVIPMATPVFGTTKDVPWAGLTRGNAFRALNILRRGGMKACR